MQIYFGIALRSNYEISVYCFDVSYLWLSQ